MIRRLALFASALTMGIAHPAAADDPRLVERLYDPTVVVTIHGQVNVQATIMFGDGEVIENVAIGDSTAWQVTPNQRADLLFVKPLQSNATTNMTVVTNRHTYLFDLVAGRRPNPLYVLRFTYPEPIVPPEEQQADGSGAPGPAGVTATELAAANDPYAVTDPAALNFAWQNSGEPSLLPERVYDDGQSTFLTWGPDRRVPAILIENFEGVEGPVNSAVRGNTTIVDGVPPRIILRSGEERAVLTYAGPGTRQTAANAASFAASQEPN